MRPLGRRIMAITPGSDPGNRGSNPCAPANFHAYCRVGAIVYGCGHTLRGMTRSFACLTSQYGQGGETCRNGEEGDGQYAKGSVV